MLNKKLSTSFIQWVCTKSSKMQLSQPGPDGITVRQGQSDTAPEVISC